MEIKFFWKFSIVVRLSPIARLAPWVLRGRNLIRIQYTAIPGKMKTRF